MVNGHGVLLLASFAGKIDIARICVQKIHKHNWKNKNEEWSPKAGQ
jgi:hypothetical protein